MDEYWNCAFMSYERKGCNWSCTSQFHSQFQSYHEFWAINWNDKVEFLNALGWLLLGSREIQWRSSHLLHWLLTQVNSLSDHQGWKLLSTSSTQGSGVLLHSHISRITPCVNNKHCKQSYSSSVSLSAVICPPVIYQIHAVKWWSLEYVL